MSRKWIVSDKDHLGGKPRVQGTRISIAFLLECLASGMSVAEIVDAYPTLTENAVRGAIGSQGRRFCDSPSTRPDAYETSENRKSQA